jgi:hypothetical protein
VFGPRRSGSLGLQTTVVAICRTTSH